MVLKLKTFANQKPCSFFKALGHPKIASQLEAFKSNLLAWDNTQNISEKWIATAPMRPRNDAQIRHERSDAIHKTSLHSSFSVYDPEGHLEDFLAMTGLPAPSLIYIQAVEALNPGTSFISKIQQDKPNKLLILSFDPEKHLTQIGHFLTFSCEIVSLKDLRLPDSMLTDPKSYLSDLNFATNFAFFREAGGWHTRLKTANYWAKYGSKDLTLWAILFDKNGETLAQWEEPLSPAVHSLVIDSRDVKKRFHLSDFTGQLFIHITGTKGHSIVKYALDTFHDDGMISATHDANAWPPQYFAGLPAPREGEKVSLWLQNSHPFPVPAQGVRLNFMGSSRATEMGKDIPPFGTYEWDVTTFFPTARWPQQIELEANYHFVRPRYEVINEKGYRCMAHVNVERNDLKSDPKLKEFKDIFGKGFILPAPLFPMNSYITSVLPTPMSRELHSSPLKALIYDKEGTLKGSYSFGNLPRHHQKALVLNSLHDTGKLTDLSLGQDYGHVELIYDFEEGDDADGWLHALFRYEHKTLPAQAETSFGSHIFNTAITYKNEPQSYKGPPPGLTTGLFLRVDDDIETFCHLIYPTSSPWHPTSDTTLILYTKEGQAITETSLRIPQSGSRQWVYQEAFSPSDREKARGGYVMIQDKTCRLFGYHGLRHKDGSFSLDHMFGF